MFLKLLSRSLDILQGEDILVPFATLETVIRKLVALQSHLSSMAIGLADAIEDATRHCFQKVIQNDSAIIAAVTLPKFKLKWVESQQGFI